MRKIIPPFLLITLVAFMSCMEDNTRYDLIGKKGVIEYPDAKAHVYYQTETALHWKVIHANGEEATGNETVSYKRLSDEWHFLNWIEKDGQTISQVINTKTGEVKTFWSFNDENSDRGGRSSIFPEGSFSFEK